jgi:hypothetical protein
MFIEFVDSLRCTRPHEESWLVAAADRMEGRSIVQGTLGCPVCGAQYAIRDGVADFRAPGAEPASGSSAPAVEAPSASDDGQAIRAAALLGLDDAGGTAALAGSWGAVAPAVLAVAPVHLLLVDPPFRARGGDGLSVLRTGGGALPLAAACLRGAALDEATAGDRAAVDSAVRALRAGGRLVAPAATPVPEGVAELARDVRDWVAERHAPTSAPVALGRSRR